MSDDADARSDFSCSSVDQFLRDNGFSISGLEEGLSLLSGDDEELTSDADERAAPSAHVAVGSDSVAGELSPLQMSAASLEPHSLSGNGDSPRFVLLDDEDLLLVGEGREEHDIEADARQWPRTGSGSGDGTSERPEAKTTSVGGQHREGSRSQQTLEEVAGEASFEHEEANEPLDRSMLFGGSEFSLSSIAVPVGGGSATHSEQGDAQSASHSAASSGLEMAHESIASTPGRHTPSFSSIYQMTPQQKAPAAAVASAASFSSLPASSPSSSASSRSSGRRLDQELSDALGVPSSSPATVHEANAPAGRSRASTSQRRSGSSSTRRAQQPSSPRTPRVLVTEDVEDGSAEVEEERRSDRADERGRGRWNQHLDTSRELSTEEVGEGKEDGHGGEDEAAGTTGKGEPRRRDADEGEGDWGGLNDLLRKNGLPVVRFQHSGLGEALPDRESLFSVVHDFVVQLERKNEIIQDLVLASNRSSRVQSRREGELETSEKKNEEVRRALETAKADIQRLKALQRKERESAELLAKKLKNSCLQLQQQLKVSEHRVKAKEVLVERMQTKLQQQVDKENMSKTRDRRAFRNLQQRDPRRANPRDSQSLETIGVYEAQREQMQEELEHLKTQVAALNSELRDKDNYIARRGEAARQAEPPVWDDYTDEDPLGRASGAQSRSRRGRYQKSPSVGSDDMMLEQLEAARREQELAAAKLRHREAAMIKKVAMIEQELLTAREMIGELKEENANLTLEAESRPSIRDYRLGQRRIHQLERQVAENKLALEEASDLNELRKYMGTKELVERDRLNHRLHLNRLNTLPRETTLEIVKHVCRVLRLTDITLIAPSLDKLCSVVIAVPRMEKFIRDVCGFVFLHVNDDLDAKDAGKATTFELEQVLPTLQQWAAERRKLYALEGFKASVVTELCKRSVEPSILSDKEDNKQSDGPPSQPTSLSRAVHIVAELVELEKNVLQHREIYSQAAVELERRPSVLINQIVRHFSHLFQVKSIEGVLPKVNETYLFVNEMKNFLHVVQELLHLKKKPSLVQCLDAIRERLEEGAAPASSARPAYRSERYPDGHDGQEENVHSDNIPNFVVDKRRAQDGGRSSSQTDLVGVRQVREMTVLVRELKRELGAATMEEILPRTKRLMELLSLSIHNTDPGEEGEREYA